MNGAHAIAAGLMLRPPRDPYVSKYPVPDVQRITPSSPPVQEAVRGNAKGAVAAAAFVGLIACYAMHLINLRMQNLGIAASLISLSVAAQAFAIFAGALIARHIVARRGLRGTISLSSIVCCVALVAIFFTADVRVINALRIMFALGLTFLLIASEYLVTARGDDSSRGRMIGWYTTALGAGAIVGPLLARIIGINEASSFLAGASMLLFSAAALRSCLLKHEGAPLRRTPSYKTVTFMPAAFLAAFVFGIADNGGLSMLPVYGSLKGYDNSSAANLAVFAALGAVALQFPIGWLAAKRDTTPLFAILAVGILILLAMLPIAIHHSVGTLAIAVLLGGLIEGLYTVGLVAISRDRRVENLSSINACFISVCAFGEVVGPAASGASMYWLGPDGWAIALIVAFGLYALGMLVRLTWKQQHAQTF